MRRMLEIIRRARAKYPSDTFFDGVALNLARSGQARAFYNCYERALVCLDSASLEEITRKAVAHFCDHRDGQLKQGFFHQLNEAFAYRHLVRCGYTKVKILCEEKTSKPDLSYRASKRDLFCEVKTLGISDAEIGRRGSGAMFTANYHELSDGFLRKLRASIVTAQEQIAVRGDGLVFVLVTFDDFTMTYYPRHRRELQQFLSDRCYANVYVKAGIWGQRGIAGPKSP